jgi:hypothetical protein
VDCGGATWLAAMRAAAHQRGAKAALWTLVSNEVFSYGIEETREHV